MDNGNADNGNDVREIVLPHEPRFVAEHRPDLLGGVTIVKGTALDGRPIVAVPYCVWDNRRPGPMAVWLRQYGKPINPNPDDPTWQGKLYRPLDPDTLDLPDSE